jgi:hypothetical protein
VTTLAGDELLFHWPEDGLKGSRVSVSCDDSLLGFLTLRAMRSCKRNSTILGVSGLLLDQPVYSSLMEYEHTQQNDSVEAEHHDSGTDSAFSRLSLLFIIFPCVVVLLGCGIIAFIRGLQPIDTHQAPVEQVEVCDDSDSEAAEDPAQPPKVRQSSCVLCVKCAHARRAQGNEVLHAFVRMWCSATA